MVSDFSQILVNIAEESCLFVKMKRWIETKRIDSILTNEKARNRHRRAYIHTEQAYNT